MTGVRRGRDPLDVFLYRGVKSMEGVGKKRLNQVFFPQRSEKKGETHWIAKRCKDAMNFRASTLNIFFHLSGKIPLMSPNDDK